MVIREDTSIWDLVKAGIMPEWMAQECDDHAMTQAEYVLCEFDWEYGWDLGKYYTKEQSETLERVRAAIREGIEAFRSNPELVREYEEQKALKERKERLRGRYKKELYGYIRPEDIDWIVDYIIQHDTLPYLYFLAHKIIYGFDRLSDRQKARLMQIGVPSGSLTPLDEIKRQFPDLRKSALSAQTHDAMGTDLEAETIFRSPIIRHPVPRRQSCIGGNNGIATHHWRQTYPDYATSCSVSR